MRTFLLAASAFVIVGCGGNEAPTSSDASASDAPVADGCGKCVPDGAPNFSDAGVDAPSNGCPSQPPSSDNTSCLGSPTTCNYSVTTDAGADADLACVCQPHGEDSRVHLRDIGRVHERFRDRRRLHEVVHSRRRLSIRRGANRLLRLVALRRHCEPLERALHVVRDGVGRAVSGVPMRGVREDGRRKSNCAQWKRGRRALRPHFGRQRVHDVDAIDATPEPHESNGPSACGGGAL